jgi:Domain of unknown function (DUF4389)
MEQEQVGGGPGRVTHPVRFVVTDDLRRSRVTVLVRVVLALPHLMWATVWGSALALLVPFQWLWAIFAGRLESDVHSFLTRFLRYHVHLSAYLLLLANPFPRFHGLRGYPVDIEVDAPERQNRASVLFRLVLALPALIFLSVLQVVLFVIALLGWFASLALGWMPEGMRELGAYCLRYQTQTLAYLLLLTQAYPSLAGGEGTVFLEPATPSAHE